MLYECSSAGFARAIFRGEVGKGGEAPLPEA